MKLRFRTEREPSGKTLIYASRADDGRSVGFIGFEPYFANYSMIGDIQVEPWARRQGVATQLYHRAAKASWKSWFNLPLGSGEERSPEAEAFWQKMVRLGLAKYENALGIYYFDPPVPSLKAMQGSQLDGVSSCRRCSPRV